MGTILVFNAIKAIRLSLKEFLEFESYNVEFEEELNSAYSKLISTEYDAVICDIDPSRMEGVALLEKVRQNNNKTPFLMMVKELDLDVIVKIIKLERSYLVKNPVNLGELKQKLRELFLEEEKEIVSKKVSEQNRIVLNSRSLSSIIGDSSAMQNMFKIIDKVSPTDQRVLIIGSNGTGKELVARRIHECSKRCKKPFIAVNCAAIPSELVESYLFGHEKGSFTSAVKMHRGSFEQADGGTLFLDEIGDMSLSAQAKILRVLQEKKIMRVGGETEMPVDVRVIAATNKDLRQEIKEGRFREDLYHRLSVIPIRMPSLAERREDIPLLIAYFIEKIKEASDDKTITIDKEAIEALQQLPWTGNVRELENSIERLSVLCNNVITKLDVDEYVGAYSL
ncbi:MAG: sigma-54-dependent Fis family transcriptional regulator [Bacteroidales bacterium]|nr:sigma-54-dependent Fis family transcriptional regulator [Bacteroidales bacterium]